MKQMTGTGKRIAILLILLTVSWAFCLAANSEETDRSVWECYTCGGLSDWNYCPWCGAGKPIALVQCPQCHIMYHQDDQYVFCKSCGSLLHPEDLTGLSDDETIIKRLNLFMIYWRPNRTKDLVELCAPSWKEQQESASSALFYLLGNRNAVSYELETAQISEDRTACEIHMNCMISKNNGKAPVPFHVSLKMVAEDGEWFIDPATMQMEELPGDVTTEAHWTMPPSPTPTPSTTPTPTPTTGPTPTPSPTIMYDYYCYMCGCLSSGADRCMFCGAPRGARPTTEPTPVVTVPTD